MSSRAVRPGLSTLIPPATDRTAWTSSLPGAVLLRYPAAPASSAPRTYSSSSYALTISTRTSGWSRVSWRVTSTPFIGGSRISISTTSGPSWLTRARATGPPSASPTTWRSGCASRIWRVPARCRAWSSTTTTRITCASMDIRLGANRAPGTGETTHWSCVERSDVMGKIAVPHACGPGNTSIGAPIEVLPGPQACGTAIFPMTSDRSTHDQWVVSPVPGARLAPSLMSMEAQVIRVVVVDDHALHRAGTRQILEAHPDLQVVGEADGGPVALALVNQLGPDVVLMDIRLPGMNGIEVTRQLTRDHPEVRVLMVSAYDEDEYVRGALEAGAAGYLSKTAPGKELVEAVRAVAGGATVLQPGLTARLLIAARQLDQAGDRQR